ncbi:MAG TPA: M23 family metallopeptidase [Methylomirabilota bacterium]|nr:M23 family metallopeptidase [Methylomirabilota bacterium]
MKRAAAVVLILACLAVAAMQTSRGQAAPASSQAKPSDSAPKSLPQPMAYDKAFPLAKDSAEKFLTGGGGPLWDIMNAHMQKAVGDSREKWNEICAGIAQQIGHVTQTLNERMLPSLQIQVYTRLLRTDGFPGLLVATVALMPDGKIGGISARPVPNPAESKFLEYKDKNSYRFPLTGEWTIYQGGRTVYDNYHAAFSDERFAYDIIAFREGSMYREGGTSLEAFYGFGQPVAAAAAGKVVSSEDKYDDNPIGEPSATAPKPGNNVVIDHGNGEFTMYAHLKRGSVKVKAGDMVKAGQQIGEVGNTGNSPIPHLHFHLQNTATWFQGEGLPVFFHGATVNGKVQPESEPVRGDVVKGEPGA